MIERLNSLPENMPNNMLSARIKALYNTYCETVGIDIFRQVIDGNTTAIFGGMNNSFTLIALGDADFSELNEYFSFIGALCCCDGMAAGFLKPQKTEISSLYRFDLKTAFTDFPYCNMHEPISGIYSLLENGTDGDIELPPFDYWYTDFCVRFNHNAAEYSVIRNAVAVCGFMTDKASLITGVAVAKSDRGKGLGSAVLSTLIHNIRSKYPESEIFAATQSAGRFYEKLNFKHIGEVALCSF